MHDVATDVGATIRILRRQRGMTLVELAAKSDLSHSFLSQLERGLQRPSMASLHRIAIALNTTQPALMAGRVSDGDPSKVSLVRAGTGTPMANPGGTARALVTGTRQLYPILFEGAEQTFDQFYTHDGDEMIYVVTGSIEVELPGESFQLGPGDTLYYPGGLPHRWRSTSEVRVNALFVQEGSRHVNHSF